MLARRDFPKRFASSPWLRTEGPDGVEERENIGACERGTDPPLAEFRADLLDEKPASSRVASIA
ncbi:MAG: hypothetical protein ACUVR0_11560 [Candidatus Aminicenantales bacterium]